MGILTVFFGLPVNGPAAFNLSVQPINRGHPDENTRIQQLLNLSKQPAGRIITSRVSYWQQHSIRVAMRRLAFKDLMRAASEQATVARQNIQCLGDLYSKLLTTSALPRLFGPMQIASAAANLRKQQPNQPIKMLWLAVAKGIRAGPISVQSYL